MLRQKTRFYPTQQLSITAQRTNTDNTNTFRFHTTCSEVVWKAHYDKKAFKAKQDRFSGFKVTTKLLQRNYMCRQAKVKNSISNVLR